MGRREERWEGGREEQKGGWSTDQHSDKPVVLNQKLCYSSPSVGADSDSPKCQGRGLQILLEWQGSVRAEQMAGATVQSIAWEAPFSQDGQKEQTFLKSCAWLCVRLDGPGVQQASLRGVNLENGSSL